MTKPTIHMNGTGKETLFNQYEAAYNAIETAIEAVRQATPNGRDYYPQEPGAINAAATEHWSRIELLNKIKEEMLALLIHCHQA